MSAALLDKLHNGKRKVSGPTWCAAMRSAHKVELGRWDVGVNIAGCSAIERHDTVRDRSRGGYSRWLESAPIWVWKWNLTR